MKKKLVVMCMLFITCVVTSCSGNNNGKTEADNIQTQTFPQQYRYSSEHLRIDLQEITPQEVSWKNGPGASGVLDLHGFKSGFLCSLQLAFCLAG